MPATLYVAMALLAVVIVRRFAPVVASSLGIAVAAGIGAWGTFTYSRGGGMAFLGARIPPAVFFGFVAVLLGFESLNLVLSIKSRRRAPPAP